MRLITILFALALFGGAAHAQGDNANLLVQSPDGKIVKLVWFIKVVPADFSGFDIKRKDGLGEWHTLNTTPLLPGISLKKDLSPFEPDNTEATRIKERLKDMLKAGKLHEYDYTTYMAKWRNNEKDIQDVMHLSSLDFDISVITGFGFVDHSATQKTDYQYGLFIHGTDKLLDKAAWNYGEIPDLNVVREITSRSVRGKNGVQLIWNADMAKVRTSFVAGFNVYKRGIRLNDRPIVSVNARDNSEYTWNDAGANSSVSDQYSISAESLFGIEGIIKSYTYNPDDHPAEYKKTTVTQISSLGFYFKDGISIDWSFPREYERFIKGFFVEKDNMPDGYIKVSDMLSPDTRSFIDKTGSPVSGAIRMRVSVVYNDKTSVPGAERLYSYFPLIDPPKPQGTRVVMAVENKVNVARISWDPIINGDSTSHHYIVYAMVNGSNKAGVIADKIPLKQTNFSYPIPAGIGAVYKFYVVAAGRSGSNSIPGDTVAVNTPSTELPAPVISKAVAEGDKAAIQWQSAEIPDLAGFRIYDDATIVADEKVLNKASRDFVTGTLLPGTTHNYTIRAISEKGVLSAPSAVVPVVMPAAKK